MTHDFIVIGAGIAGASLAYELARSSRVCLIEGESRAGPMPPDRWRAAGCRRSRGVSICILLDAARGARCIAR